MSQQNKKSESVLDCIKTKAKNDDLAIDRLKLKGILKSVENLHLLTDESKLVQEKIMKIIEEFVK